MALFYRHNSRISRPCDSPDASACGCGQTAAEWSRGRFAIRLGAYYTVRRFPGPAGWRNSWPKRQRIPAQVPKDGDGAPPKESRRARRKRELEDESIQEEEAFFKEVSEELRAERTLTVLKKYGSLLFTVGALLIAAVAGWQYWQSTQSDHRVESSRQYANATALLIAGKTKEAIAAFALVGREGSSGYAAMARLREGSLRATQGDAKGAIAAYRRLADNEDAPAELRQIALLMWAFHGVDGGAAPAEMISRLKPMTAAASPWRFLAAELTGYYLEKSGKKAAARDVFKRLADDTKAPDSLRSRARDMLILLGKS